MPKIGPKQDQVDAIMAKNPSMAKSEAWGIVMNQSKKKKAGGGGSKAGTSKGPDDPMSVMGGKSTFDGLFGKSKKT